MRGLRHPFLLLLLLLTGGVSNAQPQVQVVGLFSNAAVLLVDGERKLVRAGETGPQGVQVVRADSRSAVLRIGGLERTYLLSREYSAGGMAVPVRQQMSIARGAGGHYWAEGSVNGQPVQFLVDTGATSVAMNEQEARRLGVDYRSGVPMVASTAGGMVKGWRLTLDRVKVGSLEVLGVEAVVLQGGAPGELLLGMSFLNRVRWREEQGVLLLESKL